MAYTVPWAFDQFFGDINLPGDHRETASSRRDRIVSILKDDFSILDGFAIGSIPKFTAIKGYADLDIMIVLHYGKHIKDNLPSKVLSDVRKSLAKYRTDLRRNGQAVTLYYETWPNVDVVPVSRHVDTNDNLTHYSVPDMHKETWISSLPSRHAQNMTDRNSSYGPEFKKIVKMIKWWNKQHSDLMEAYHIEMLALRALQGKFTSYPWEVFSFFDKAVELSASLLWYDLSYADNYLIGRPTQRENILVRLKTARDKARSAWYATHGMNDDDEKAIGIWRQIFGDKFPSYG
jgi:hypothetical protein